MGCMKLSGSMSLEQRDKAIRSFKEQPDVKVLLISLKAGGVALNLTVASRIFLMG
jgi:DNA repair protein RAD16